MLKKTSLILLAVSIALLGGSIWAGEVTDGEFAVGARTANGTDSLNRASEFMTEEDSTSAVGWWNLDLGEASRLQMNLMLEDADNQSYSMRLDFSPSLWLEADYDTFVHHLPHDPLTNLAGWDGEGKVVQHTDLDPGGRYGLEFEQAHAALVWRPKDARAWEVALKVRNLWRKGSKQHRSTDHCYSCHIVGQNLAVDEEVHDLTFQAGHMKQNWGVQYTFTTRDYNDDSMDATRWFDPAAHPTKTTPTNFPLPVFGNRLQLGVLPNGFPAWTEGAVGLNTEFERNSHTLTAFWTGEKDHIDGAIAKYTVEGKDNTARGGVNTGYDLDYTSFLARWTHRASPRTSLRVKGRYEKVDSDDAHVPLDLNVAFAGPTAGLTYEDVYGVANAKGYVTDELTWDPDDYRVRYSAADRKVLTLGADVIYRFGDKDKHRLKVALQSKNIDRDNLSVNDNGGTETTEYTLSAQLRGTLKNRKYRYRADLEWYSADDPFDNVDGGCRAPGTDPEDPFIFPWNTFQYFQLYALRFANLTNQPTDAITLRGSLSLAPLDNSSLTIQARYSDKSNDQTQVSDWDQTTTEIGGYFWWAPSGKMYTVASAQYLLQDQDTHICIPLMGG